MLINEWTQIERQKYLSFTLVAINKGSDRLLEERVIIIVSIPYCNIIIAIRSSSSSSRSPEMCWLFQLFCDSSSLWRNLFVFLYLVTHLLHQFSLTARNLRGWDTLAPVNVFATIYSAVGPPLWGELRSRNAQMCSTLWRWGGWVYILTYATDAKKNW